MRRVLGLAAMLGAGVLAAQPPAPTEGARDLFFAGAAPKDALPPVKKPAAPAARSATPSAAMHLGLRYTLLLVKARGFGGVPVDPQGRSAAPDVYAAGDAALVFDPALARHLRTDHWEAAARQGVAAARAMLGLEPARTPLPSFWSDQHGVRIQYVGQAAAGDRVAIDGDPEGRDFEATFTKAGVPVAALLVGRPRALADARRRVQTGLDSLSPQQEAPR